MTEKRTIILAENYQREDLLRNLLQVNQGIAKTTILPLNAWLSSFLSEETDETSLFITCYERIRKLGDSLNVLKDIIAYPSTTAELLRFLKEIIQYDIALESLPKKTLIQNEIKTILLDLVDLPLREKQVQKIVENLDLSADVRLYPFFGGDLVETRLKNQLMRQGVAPYPVKRPQKRSVCCFKALNKRQEIEAIAQYLVQLKRPLNDHLLVLCNPQDYMPLIVSVFDRYHIPYASSLAEGHPLTVQKFVKLLKLVENPTRHTLRECLVSHCFSHPCDSLIRYCETFDTTFEECLHELKKVDQTCFNNIVYAKRDVEALYLLEQRANEELALVRNDLNAIAACSSSLDAKAVLIYNILRHNATTRLESSEFRKIKSLLEKHLTRLNDTEMLIYLLEQVPKTIRETSTDCLYVTTLQEAALPLRKTLILVGADNKAFPAFKTRHGIIDEDYCRCIGYPTKEERYTFAMDEIRSILNLYEQLIFSYAYGNYSGKEQKISFELEQIVNDYGPATWKLWPLVENEALDFATHRLSKDLSQQLFFKENKLKGSVSSFEAFNRCPYNYFLKYGIQLNDFTLDVDNAKLGSILHFVIETLVRTYGKDYVNATPETLQEIIDEGFKELYGLFGNNRDYLDVIKKRFLNNTKQGLRFLSVMEKETTFEPINVEKRFRSTIEKTSLPIELGGIIDRIDVTDNYYRIIDYKSSHHRLNGKNVENGTQLQLLTYLWLIQEKMEKLPFGTYYFSFRNANIPVSAAKFDRRKKSLETFNEQDWSSDCRKEHRLQGWTFIDDPELSQQMVKLELHDYESVKDTLILLYEQILQRLLAGDIQPKPVDDACRYCGFLGICKYYGETADDDETSEESL